MFLRGVTAEAAADTSDAPRLVARALRLVDMLSGEEARETGALVGD